MGNLARSQGRGGAYARHFVSVFNLGAVAEGHGDDAEEDASNDRRVGLPVLGLRVPTTGRRPDVLGVAVKESR